MCKVAIRIVVLCASSVIAAQAADSLTDGLTPDIPTASLGRPSSLLQPAVTADDPGVPSPFFNIGISTPKPTSEDSTPQVTYSNNANPGTEPLTLKKKRKGDVLGKMSKAEAERSKDSRMPLPVSVAPSVSHPPSGSPPSSSCEDKRVMKKSHTLILGDFASLLLPSASTGTGQTDGASGDIMESTVLNNGDDDL